MAEFHIYFETKRDVTVEMIEKTGATKVSLLFNDENDDDKDDYMYVATVNSQKMMDEVAKLCTNKPEPESQLSLRTFRSFHAYLGQKNPQVNNTSKMLKDFEKQLDEDKWYPKESPETLRKIDEYIERKIEEKMMDKDKNMPRNEFASFLHKAIGEAIVEFINDENERVKNENKRQKIDVSDEESDEESDEDISADSGHYRSNTQKQMDFFDLVVHNIDISESDEESSSGEENETESENDESDESDKSDESIESEEDYDIFQTVFKTIKKYF